MKDRYSMSLETALAWAKKNKPEASPYHHYAFANSVAYLVTGASGGYSGPSIREHLCSYALAGDGEIVQEVSTGFQMIVPDRRMKYAGEWTIERAIAFCEPICFGILSRQALFIVETQYCFDDDPSDLRLVGEWEIEELKTLALEKKRGKLPQKKWNRLRFLRGKYKS